MTTVLCFTLAVTTSFLVFLPLLRFTPCLRRPLFLISGNFKRTRGRRRKAWMDGATTAPAATMSPKDIFQHWTVAELARFMRAKDLARPYAILQANGVTGADLLDMSASDLEA